MNSNFSDKVTAPQAKRMFKCPICNARLEGWKKGGDVNKNKMFCPSCVSKPRHRMVYKYLDNQGLLDYKTSSKKTLLHIAPETCLLVLRSQFGRYIGSDLNAERPGVTHSFSIENIELPDASVDLVICNHVLEHVGDDTKAVREFSRVLKSDGFALVTIPISEIPNTYEDPSITSPAERKRAFGQEDHVRVYGADVASRFSNCDMSVQVVTGSMVSGDNAKRLGIKPAERMFVMHPVKD